jgi:hypothetical protein
MPRISLFGLESKLITRAFASRRPRESMRLSSAVINPSDSVRLLEGLVVFIALLSASNMYWKASGLAVVQGNGVSWTNVGMPSEIMQNNNILDMMCKRRRLQSARAGEIKRNTMSVLYHDLQTYLSSTSFDDTAQGSQSEYRRSIHWTLNRDVRCAVGTREKVPLCSIRKTVRSKHNCS